MREKMKDFDSPERVWKDVYHNLLYDLEEIRLRQRFPVSDVIERLPKASLWMVYSGLMIAVVVLFVAGWFGAKHELPCGFLSSASLNLGMGLVSGLMLFWLSDRIRKIIDGYSDVIRIMRRRYKVLCRVHDEELKRPYFVLRTTEDKELTCEWIMVHRNFVFTMISHLKFLKCSIEKKAIKSFMSDVLKAEEEGKRISESLKEPYSSLPYETVVQLSKDVWQLEVSILKMYEKGIRQLESCIYNIKYGKQRKI